MILRVRRGNAHFMGKSWNFMKMLDFQEISWKVEKSRKRGISEKAQNGESGPRGPPRLNPALLITGAACKQYFVVGVMVSWHFEDFCPPPKWIKCIYFGGGRGDRNGPKSQNRKNVKILKMSENCGFGWKSAYFGDFPGISPIFMKCAHRRPALPKTLLGQCFLMVLGGRFRPKPQKLVTFCHFRTFPHFSWK